MNNIEIRKCLRRSDGVKMVIVPKESKIEKDDYVYIEKIDKKKIKKGKIKKGDYVRIEKINKKEVK